MNDLQGGNYMYLQCLLFIVVRLLTLQSLRHCLRNTAHNIQGNADFIIANHILRGRLWTLCFLSETFPLRKKFKFKL
jgi:hypothetical protein